MIKYTVTITAEVVIDDENIAKKYPNFNINHSTSDKGLREFAKLVAQDGISEPNSLSHYGYKVTSKATSVTIYPNKE